MRAACGHTLNEAPCRSCTRPKRLVGQQMRQGDHYGLLTTQLSDHLAPRPHLRRRPASGIRAATPALSTSLTNGGGRGSLLPCLELAGPPDPTSRGLMALARPGRARSPPSRSGPIFGVVQLTCKSGTPVFWALLARCWRWRIRGGGHVGSRAAGPPGGEVNCMAAERKAWRTTRCIRLGTRPRADCGIR